MQVIGGTRTSSGCEAPARMVRCVPVNAQSHTHRTHQIWTLISPIQHQTAESRPRSRPTLVPLTRASTHAHTQRPTHTNEHPSDSSDICHATTPQTQTSQLFQHSHRTHGIDTRELATLIADRAHILSQSSRCHIRHTTSDIAALRYTTPNATSTLSGKDALASGIGKARSRCSATDAR